MSVADSVFDAVRADIVSGRIPRGTMLSIYQLAEQYGVSRTPAREAVLRLANIGLVTIEKNHGVRIKGLTASDVRDIFHTRILIEVPAAYHAAQNDPPGVRDRFRATMDRLQKAAGENDLQEFIAADRELHDTIISWNGNRKAASIVAQIRDETHALGASTFADGRSMLEVLAEHEPVYTAILDGDAAAAAANMKTHLERTAQLLLRQLSESDTLSFSETAATPLIFIEL